MLSNLTKQNIKFKEKYLKYLKSKKNKDLEKQYKSYLTEYTKLQYMIDSELNHVYQFIQQFQPKEKKNSKWIDLVREIRINKDLLS